MSDPIPANTTYFKDSHSHHDNYYNDVTNSIEWTGTIGPNQTKVFEFWVKVNKGTPTGTEITNLATLSDDALGSSASATTIVKKKH